MWAARKKYQGIITYNCDKYQEGHIHWWDCLDMIVSSGYYPINDLDEAFDHIRRVAGQAGKPFMFIKCGSPSRKGSEYAPNNWSNDCVLDLDTREQW